MPDSEAGSELDFERDPTDVSEDDDETFFSNSMPTEKLQVSAETNSTRNFNLTFRDVESDVERDVESDVERDVENDVERDVESDVERDVESGVYGDVESGVYGDVESDVDGDVESDVDGGLERDVESDLGSDVDDGDDVHVFEVVFGDATETEIVRNRNYENFFAVTDGTEHKFYLLH